MKNNNPKQFKDVKVYFGYGSYMADAEIREVVSKKNLKDLQIFIPEILLPVNWKCYYLWGVWTPVYQQLVHLPRCIICSSAVIIVYLMIVKVGLHPPLRNV